jgi:putative endonuclease
MQNHPDASTVPRSHPLRSKWLRRWSMVEGHLWRRRLWRRWCEWWTSQPLPSLRRSNPISIANLSPQQIGHYGERLAADYLTSSGYQLVALGFRGPIGYQSNGTPIEGEIDLIAYDPSTSPPTLVFVEVKTRRSTRIATPEAAVDRRKRARLRRTAKLYLRLLHLASPPLRFDVLSLVLEPGLPPRFSHFKNFFAPQSDSPPGLKRR